MAGMSHIVAVSGMHLSILFALVYALTLRQRVLSALLGIPVAFFFAAVAGFTPSVTRAAVMLSLSLLGPPVQAGVRSAVCFGLCRSGAAPGESFDGGIGQLSAVCGGSGGDFVLQQPAVRLDDPRAGKGQRLWTAGMPRSGVICGGEPGGYGVYGSHGAWTFGVVSLLSPLTNLVSLWAVSLGFYGVLAACGLGAVWLPLGKGVAGAQSRSFG